MRALLPSGSERRRAREACSVRSPRSARRDATPRTAGRRATTRTAARPPRPPTPSVPSTATEQANGALHDAVGTLHGGGGDGGEGHRRRRAVGRCGGGCERDEDCRRSLGCRGDARAAGPAEQPERALLDGDGERCGGEVTEAADGAVADASATVEGAAAKFASFASTMSGGAHDGGRRRRRGGLDKKGTAAAMDPSPEPSLVDRRRPRRRGRGGGRRGARRRLFDERRSCSPAARSALGGAVDDAGSALASLSSLSGANLTAGCWRGARSRLTSSQSSATPSEASTGCSRRGRAQWKARFSTASSGAAGKLPKDGAARWRRTTATADARGAQPRPLGRRGVLRDDGARELDGLAPCSTASARARTSRCGRRLGEMLDALVLLLQSAATQYGVRAEVDAYVLPLVTLVQQYSARTTARSVRRRRRASVRRRRRGGAAARSRCSPPDKRTTRRRPTATATATALADVAAEIAAKRGGLGAAAMHWRPSMRAVAS